MDSVKTNFSLPFNAYDFFGYILPGSLFSLGLLYLFKDKINIDSKIICQITEMSAVPAILLSLGLLAILYFVGQVIGCISHLLYDRLFVRNVIGYPFQYILDLEPRPDASVRITYLLLVVLSFATILAPLIYETMCRNEITTQKGGWIFCVIWISFFAILFIVSFFLRTVLVISRMRRMNNMGKIERDAEPSSIEKDSVMIKICDIATRIAWYLFYPMRKLTSTDTKVHQKIKKAFIEKMKVQSEIDLTKQTEYNSDAYWMTYICLIKADQRHDAKINNWLNLYGCLRNYSCAFLILSMAISIRQWLNIANDQVLLPDTRYLIATLALSFVLFVRYWIIYFGYYTKYIGNVYFLSQIPLRG